MKYIEVTFSMSQTEPFRDLLVDLLGNEGPYESFVDITDGLKAYVPLADYDAAWLQNAIRDFPILLTFKAEEMEDKDWNAEWEKGHQPVLVHYDGGSVFVRAPFHPCRPDADYEIIIEPKMSFGTAHHPTTYMMLGYVAEIPVQGRRVLDMGCGTAILAILAARRGAAQVVGIDIDEWAFRNAQENASTNNVAIDLHLGDATLLANAAAASQHGDANMGAFDIILANINRNILLADMHRYASVLIAGGSLIISGFYQADEASLLQKAATLGLSLLDSKCRDGWSALRLIKN